jgi:hypothetical protein
MLSSDELKDLERRALIIPMREVVTEARRILGDRLVAFMSGKNDARFVDELSLGSEKPNPIEELRLRYGYLAAAIIEKEYDAETARAAFMGMNTHLGDEAPAAYLRDHEKEEDFKEVVFAAKNLGEMGA